MTTVSIIGAGGLMPASALGTIMKAYKYDVFITAADPDVKLGSGVAELLKAASFAPWLSVAAGTDKSSRLRLRVFGQSASCAVMFGHSGKSPLADEGLRAAIRDRFERTRGEFRPIPVIFGKSQWARYQTLISEELPGVEVRPPVIFSDAIDERESLRRLILGIRGVDSEPQDAWERGWLRQQVRRRAENALNVDWAKLASEVSRPSTHAPVADRDYMVPFDFVPTKVTDTCLDEYAQRLSYMRWFERDGRRQNQAGSDFHSDDLVRRGSPSSSSRGGERLTGYRRERLSTGIFRTLKGYVAQLLRGLIFGETRRRQWSILTEHFRRGLENVTGDARQGYDFGQSSVRYLTSVSYLCTSLKLLCKDVGAGVLWESRLYQERDALINLEAQWLSQPLRKFVTARLSSNDCAPEFDFEAHTFSDVGRYFYTPHPRLRGCSVTSRRKAGRYTLQAVSLRHEPEHDPRGRGSMLIIPLYQARDGGGARETIGVLTYYDSRGGDGQPPAAPFYTYAVEGLDGERLEELAGRLGDRPRPITARGRARRDGGRRGERSAAG